MIWEFAIIVIFMSVGVVIYPLFRGKIQKYGVPENFKLDSSQEDFFLTALLDLEEDFTLGRLSTEDYNQQKNILQRKYLNTQKK